MKAQQFMIIGNLKIKTIQITLILTQFMEKMEIVKLKDVNVIRQR